MYSPLLQAFNNSSTGHLLRNGFILFLLVIAYLALSPTARAVTPPPDGGYPNNNTAEGENALFNNTTGGYNTATGSEALFYNTTGYFNTACGFGALVANTTGFENTANGAAALEANRTGRANVANGYGALAFNTTGFQNTATGAGDSSPGAKGALGKNTTGNRNTATGNQALFRNQTDNGNTAEGFQAQANNTGSFNVAVGFTAGVNLTTGHDNIDIANAGVAGESGTLRIGNGKQTATFITGISGAVVASGTTVVVGSNGQLGTIVSSARFKDAIKPMDKASEAILALKPVIFRYKQELDPDHIPQFGLVAEQVEKVNPDLVVRGEDGKVMTVRYEAVNAMLLNEFLKEHRKVEEQRTYFESKLAQQQKQIEALTAGLQKVNAQIESAKPGARVVSGN